MNREVVVDKIEEAYKAMQDYWYNYQAPEDQVLDDDIPDWLDNNDEIIQQEFFNILNDHFGRE